MNIPVYKYVFRVLTYVIRKTDFCISWQITDNDVLIRRNILVDHITISNYFELFYMAHVWAKRKKRRVEYKKKLLKSKAVKSKTQCSRQTSPILAGVQNDPKRLKEKSHKLFSTQVSTQVSNGKLSPLRKKILKKTWAKNLQRWSKLALECLLNIEVLRCKETF